MTNTTIYLKDYSQPQVIIENINLCFDIYDKYTIVENRMNIRANQAGPISLNGSELELISIKLNETTLSPNDYDLQGQELIIKNCPAYFSLTILTKIYPAKNTALSGLFCSKQTYCTQCEAEGFRRITFYPDRPDVLSIFTTKIIADKASCPILLSNGNLVDQGELENGRHWVVWHDPFKKPCYLFALVAGNLHVFKDKYTTKTSKEIDLRIYVEPGKEDQCSHAMVSLKKSMLWDEEVYGREYDLSIFMIVAVSDFNMGAMENKGLNIFNSKYILGKAESATDEDYAHIEGVVAHEYFHNWTGNRVTCRDWFQLSLKEGLTVFRDQEFSRDMNSRDVNRIKDVEILINAQFPEDAGAMAHPVRPASYQEINNFYTATIYNKGAELIRMQHTLLGAEGFRRGMDLYFSRHDGQAVTIEDFVEAMEDASNIDLDQFRLWYSQAGTPIVTVESSYENETLILNLKQSCPPTPECENKLPFHIPIRIALYSHDGSRLKLESDLLELREAHQIFIIHNVPTKPVISLLRDFSAPIKLKHDLSEEEIVAILRYDSNGYAKWNAAKKLVMSCITALYHSSEDLWKIPQSVIKVFADILQDSSLNLALKAKLLTPPGFEDLIADLPEVDVDKIIKASDFYRKSLGQSLFADLSKIYKSLAAKEDSKMHAESYANRHLKNICLYFMMHADEAATLELCQQQFVKAKTMTDQIASFKLLCSSKNQDVRKRAIADFFELWGDDDLVMDKWFSAQAASELPETLKAVKALAKHPGFSLKNPNKVRSLISVFAFSNVRYFHALDGSGYDYLAKIVIDLDKINPQIAARLATPFTRWRSFDSKRQQLIKSQLERLSAMSLSRDLQEVVDKSLA